MVNIIGDLPENVVGVEATGEVTREDYERIIIPEVTKRLQRFDKISFLCHMGSDFKGITSGAMWDDFKFGAKNIFSWKRVALITDVGWLRNAARLFGILIPGEFKLFSNDEFEEGMKWIAQT